MSVYKDEKTGKWYALTWYHDWKGEGRQKCKRGFETKKEAQEWEMTFLKQNAADMDMTFAAFCELYEFSCSASSQNRSFNVTPRARQILCCTA